MRTTTKRRMALTVAIVLAVVCLVSLSVIALHGDHPCDGVGCELCACLEHAQAALQLLSLILLPVCGALLWAAGCAGVRLAAMRGCLSPVLLRVRMDH